MAPAPLHVHLDAPLPAAIGIGAGTVVFVAGWCVHPAGRIQALDVVLDGRPQPVEAFGMPRLDVLRALHPGHDPYDLDGVAEDPSSPDDPGLHGYRSGFWSLVEVGPRPAGTIAVALRATLDDGDVAEAALGDIEVREAPAPLELQAPAPAAGPLVAIAMAAYEPSPQLLGAQLRSLRAQTHRNWVCVISDDCSSPEGARTIEEAVDGDERFVVSRSSERLGFYRNFERALALVPAEAAFVAMSDQDDVWHADKLEALLAGLGGAELVYSDARVVTEDGTLVQATYWERRRNNHTDLTSLLVANAVTGAASLFPRALLADALPFPPAQFGHYHDHWIGLVALTRGDIAYVDRPLYDYVQHGNASLGHAAANQMRTLRSRVGALRQDPRERVRMWRLHYFVDTRRLAQVARILLLRCGADAAPAKRRALARFLGAETSVGALATLWARGARELVGRPETLGAEWMLAYAFSWRRLLDATTRERPTRRLRLDAAPPSDLAPKAGQAGVSEPAVRQIAEKIAPLQLAVSDRAPERINVLLPHIDLAHFFGGYIAKANLARRLAERGARVRIVTVDPQPPLPSGWKAQIEAYNGLAGLFDHVEVAFGRESGGLEVSRHDRFVASTWWSAHIAGAAAAALDGAPFLYLIQELESLTFPMGSYAALADSSYELPHVALFSTELLRDHFRGRGLGVFADGMEVGDAASASFQNAITVVAPPTADELRARTTRKLLFYARPEAHAARNMYELGVLALARAAALGTFRGGWELHGIGTSGPGRRVELGHGAGLQLLPRTGQGSYAEVLRDHDVGIALMHTPHPSLVPIEMASAGMLCVTTSYANKTPEALAEISGNFVTARPAVDALVTAIRSAVAGAGDAERRAAGSHVAWSRDWDRSFDDALMERVEGWLDTERNR